MPALSVFPPFEHYKDTDGTPLNNGYIYIGTDGVDAETNPVQTYWDLALTTTASQPIRTLNGYPSNNGSASNIFVDGSDYSITVKNSKGELVFSKLNFSTVLPPPSLSYRKNTIGTVTRNLSNIIDDFITVKDFGAVGDGVTNDTAAFTLAEAAPDDYIYLPEGTYIVSGISLSTTYFGPGVIELNSVIQEEFFDRLFRLSNEIIPIGGMILWPNSTVPASFLECDGSTFSAAAYPDLNTVLGGTTLPESRGEFIRGWDNGRGVDVARSILSLQANLLLSHNHLSPKTQAGSSGVQAPYGTGVGVSTNFFTGHPVGGASTTLYQTSSTGGGENRPRNLAAMLIMRAL